MNQGKAQKTSIVKLTLIVYSSNIKKPSDLFSSNNKNKSETNNLCIKKNCYTYSLQHYFLLPAIKTPCSGAVLGEKSWKTLPLLRPNGYMINSKNHILSRVHT